MKKLTPNFNQKLMRNRFAFVVFYYQLDLLGPETLMGYFECLFDLVEVYCIGKLQIIRRDSSGDVSGPARN